MPTSARCRRGSREDSAAAMNSSSSVLRMRRDRAHLGALAAPARPALPGAATASCSVNTVSPARARGASTMSAERRRQFERPASRRSGSSTRAVAALRPARPRSRRVRAVPSARWRRDRTAPRRRAGCGEESITVTPRSRCSRIRSRTSRRPNGSSPLIGSSRMSSSRRVHQRRSQSEALQHALRVLAQHEARRARRGRRGRASGARRAWRRAPRARTAVRRTRGTRRRSGSRRNTAVPAGSRARARLATCSIGSPSSQALPAGRLQQPGQHLDGGGLAGAVRAQVAEHLAARAHRRSRRSSPRVTCIVHGCR